jgi:D-alanyl-lipoteichoic acid acyltransferase DltB (MBOAT superfamily)
MLFNSIIFPFFFLVVVIIYYRLNHLWQNRWLLAASYFFYGWWDWRFCSLLAFSTCLDYFVSNRIAESKRESVRRILLGVTITANLGLLGFFKYFNFFSASAKSFLESLGFQPDFFTLQVILPVGISFYTFQSMSYMIDVYRREQKPEKDFMAYAVFVAFFPQLMAGPIERARRMLPQFIQKRTFNRDIVRSGIPLVLMGYFKKVVIADSMIPIVDACFTNPVGFSGIDLLLGAYAFAIQIYCDFSGYTDIARGLARFLGIELVRNFEAPYFSRDISEFWRRWHISLSSWLRDYLYIPLGGNRTGKAKTYVNIMLTMLLGGLWHGAAWTFVVWGGFHGSLLVVHRLMLKEKKTDRSAPVSHDLFGCSKDFLGIILTFHLVCVGWIFFRAPSIDIALSYFVGIIINDGGTSFFKPVVLAMVVTAIIDIGQRLHKNHEWLFRIPTFWRYVFAETIVAASVLTFGYHYRGPSPFIYFQF